MPFAGFDWTDFWEDDDYAQRQYICAPPSDELIASIEAELGYKLPESYIWLMRRHNGGTPFKTCFPMEEEGCCVFIAGIMGIGRDKTYALCGTLGSAFMIEEWQYPPIGVAICDCPSAGHDMIFLDYRACGPQGEPQVVHVDQEGDYAITKLADSFEDFIRGLVRDPEAAEDSDALGEEEMVCSEPYFSWTNHPLLGSAAAVSDDDEDLMDAALWHLESIWEKHLPVEELAAYNHLAIYLRWCMEHDLMSEGFLVRYAQVVERVKNDPVHAGLREFLRGQLQGLLLRSYFDGQGQAFAEGYYNYDNTAGRAFFPADIDDYALTYFGARRYHSTEFQQEAYLYVPFDEAYYQAMAVVLDGRYQVWQKLAKEAPCVQTEPSDLARAFMAYLNCPCQYFPPASDDDGIMAAFGYARRLAPREGFVPILVVVDETLWECLTMHAGGERTSGAGWTFDAQAVSAYRRKLLSVPLENGEAVTARLLGERQAEADDDELDWVTEILGEVAEGEAINRFGGYWDDQTEKTYPLILAEIPVQNPWEVFAYLPFGGWNECPDTPELMAVAKAWYAHFGAAAAVMTHDVLEFSLPHPVSRQQALALAMEHYAWCPDVVDQGAEDATVGKLADTLTQSTVWYFWWD